MLQLLSVREIREQVYLATLDRDGQTMEYEFTWTPPRRPGGWPTVGYPDRAAYDLIDYEPEEEQEWSRRGAVDSCARQGEPDRPSHCGWRDH